MNTQTITAAASSCGYYDPKMGWTINDEPGAVNRWSGRIPEIELYDCDFINTEHGIFSDEPVSVEVKLPLGAVLLEADAGLISQSMLEDLAQKTLEKGITVSISAVFSEDATSLCSTDTYVLMAQDLAYEVEGLEICKGVRIKEAGWDGDQMRARILALA